MAAEPLSEPTWARLVGAIASVVLAGVILLRPLLGARQFPALHTLLLLSVFSAAAALAVRAAGQGSAPRLPLTVRWLLVAVLFFAALSWAWSIQQHQSTLAALDLAAWTVLLLAAAHRGTQTHWRTVVVWGLFAVGALIAARAFWQRAVGFELMRSQPEAAGIPADRLASDRVFGTFLGPGLYGTFLVLLIPWQLGLWDWARRAGNTARLRAAGWLLLVLAGANGAVLILTRARAAWMALAVAGLAYAVIAYPRRVRVGAVLALTLAGGVLLALTPSLAATDTLRARGTYWLATLGMIQRRPLVGTGLGTWGEAYPTTFLPGGFPTELAHNDWLQRASETGIVGGLAFLALMICSLRLGSRAWRAASTAAARHKAAGLWCGLLGVCVTAAFDYPFEAPAVAWIVAVALGFTLADGWGEGRPLPRGRWTWAHAVVAVTLCAGGINVAYRAERGRAALAVASRAAHAGDLQVVLLACQRARRWTPNDPESFGLLGTAHLRLGDAKRGRGRPQPAGLAWTPDPRLAQADEGEWLLPESEYRVAALALGAAVQRTPWNPWYADRAGIAYWRLADVAADPKALARSVAYFERAAAHFPAHPAFQARLAEVYARVGDPRAAAAWVRAARLRELWRETPDIGGPSRLGADLDPA